MISKRFTIMQFLSGSIGMVDLLGGCGRWILHVLVDLFLQLLQITPTSVPESNEEKFKNCMKR